MKRRTILAALATAPLMAFANTAQALGFRRNRCCGRQTTSAAAGWGMRNVDPPTLVITYVSGPSGMETHHVVVRANVTAANTANVVKETITEVRATLVDVTTGDGVASDIMTLISSANPANAGLYEWATDIMLTATHIHRANVTAIVAKESYGTSNTDDAPAAP